MGRMVSLNVKVKQLGGLLDTKDLTEKEYSFVFRVSGKTRDGHNVSTLTSGEIGWIEDLWSRHFA